jgi:predicted membrane protein DUF2306
MSEALTVPSGVQRPSARALPIGLSLVAAIALAFVAKAALPYFRVTPAQFRWYWPVRGWLLLHVVSGMVALLSGPVQLWLGLAQRSVRTHRVLGVVYLASVGVSSLAAFYLVFHTTLGWVFGAGLAGLATAWLVTTGLAFLAIRRRLYDQHKEWMIRSYVVTTAFVTFRLLFEVLSATGVGTLHERLALCAWICWAVPLLVNEAILQGRKILSPQGLLAR